MKGEITHRLLEAIAETLGNVEDAFIAFLNAGYGASTGKLAYEARREHSKRVRRKIAREAEAKIRQRYFMMLAYLRQQGLIVRITHRKKIRLDLTPKGERKRNELKKKMKRQLPATRYGRARESNGVTIVAFDIPERERGKRAWLRSALKHLGLRMAQQSLWLGKVILPKEFLDDLLKLRLVEFVEIFEVTKSGSLAHIL